MTITAPDPAKTVTVEIVDNAFKQNPITKELAAGAGASVVLNGKESYGWYDFSIRARGFENFERR